MIIDSPRFRHRGVMFDSARHFLPVPVLKKNLVSELHRIPPLGYRKYSMAGCDGFQ